MVGNSKKLSIAFYWHMHQPVYQLTPESDYIMPWTRLHAVKDYLDMLTIIKNHKNIKLNFNIVPILVDSFIRYGEEGFHDLHSRLTVKPVEELTDEDKNFIINNFFDANYQFMILPLKEYDRLIHKYQFTKDINDFTPQEYSDLMALFNLAWIDNSHVKDYPELKALYKKGSGFTLEDRKKIIEIQRDIIRKIIPTFKKYLKSKRIELTTSPHYHPILPALVDIADVSTNANGDLPLTLGMKKDAEYQIKEAIEIIEGAFGVKPQGIWPSEHCISNKTLKLFSDLGLKWTISDEGVLSNSIKFDFVRDFNGNLENPYPLLKVYDYKSSLNVIFREAVFPNLISFEYPNHDSERAANDLYDRIKTIQNKIQNSPDDSHLLTIAMDGENCWENYAKDGAVFLNTLYGLINDDPTLETVLISDYIENEKHLKELNSIKAGSWINQDFKLWIDEPLKNLAWSYLKQVKDDLENFILLNPNHPNIARAKKEFYVCQGSDWFWWFGEPNDSGHDNIFDYLFRMHLKNVYEFLDMPVPERLNVPLIDSLEEQFDAEHPLPSAIDMKFLEISDGPVLQENKLFDRIAYGCDANNFHLKFFLNEYIQNNPTKYYQTFQTYIYMRNANKKHYLSHIRLINKTESVLPVCKEKFHNEFQLTVDEGILKFSRLTSAIQNGLWVLQSKKDFAISHEKTIDVTIPFDNLEIGVGEELEFIIAQSKLGVLDSVTPNEVLLKVKRG
ncbi:MAG: glycoside hydrolase family 57 protein [Fusobacterium sp.]|nr:glycoside hydrolase family 57 protein [Fusobacterium sp.]